MSDVSHLIAGSVSGASLVTGIAAGVVTAQVSSDPISGGAGWVGAGLLGCVLAWLFFKHLPAKDKQIAELIEKGDERDERRAQEYRASLMDLAVRAADQDRERRKDYREALEVVVNHCEKETATNSQAIQRTLSELAPLIADLRPIIEEWRSERRRDRGSHQ